MTNPLTPQLLNEIPSRQSNIRMKQELLAYLGHSEASVTESWNDLEPISSQPKHKQLLWKHRNCQYNACPLDFLSFGLTPKGKLLQFRHYVAGDPASRCSLNRAERQEVYASLSETERALLPNKGLADYEIREDAKIASMTAEEKNIYLKAKEDKAQKYQEWLAKVQSAKKE